MYYVPVRTLPQNVLDYICREDLHTADDRVGFGISVVIDLLSLLRSLFESRP